MNNRLLMGMLHTFADLDKEFHSLPGRHSMFVAVSSDRNARHVLHHKVRPPFWCGSRIEDLCDCRMIHQRQRLPLRLEARHHLTGVHPGFDHLERHAPSHRLTLLGQPHLSHASFAGTSRKSSSFSCCARSSSTARRSASSPPQACSRKAALALFSSFSAE